MFRSEADESVLAKYRETMDIVIGEHVEQLDLDTFRNMMRLEGGP